ncbi:hypothetical protein DP113_24445 [Brasilonema octagenarum UFV-E1]|uniref:Uncharacterized protein n=2 Tax=Brasilonema TaxID=383614 RepID=A0A856MJB1_9CYAN|nr:hypothetical protein [Brasilonema octagenarum UFV-OR1]QDL10642.1 hypothetical protein DP114_24530 [Brasilonema sennae CENA114]QDL16989.1 hypothetical protein DP113_24445 [Brasilonema octagenarum UFV-E1]
MFSAAGLARAIPLNLKKKTDTYKAYMSVDWVQIFPVTIETTKIGVSILALGISEDLFMMTKSRKKPEV